MIVNPKPFLTDLTGKPVSVKLKWGMEYKGKERMEKTIRVFVVSEVVVFCLSLSCLT